MVSLVSQAALSLGSSLGSRVMMLRVTHQPDNGVRKLK